MSTKSQKKLEKIYNLLERLEKLSTNGIPIIVEGKKDVLALNEFGINSDVITAKTSGKSFLDVQREIARREIREVILLFDFDRRGKEWTMRMASCMEQMRITPNLVFWRALLGLVGHDIKDIEGLTTFFKTLKKRDPNVIKYNRH